MACCSDKKTDSLGADPYKRLTCGKTKPLVAKDYRLFILPGELLVSMTTIFGRHRGPATKARRKSKSLFEFKITSAGTTGQWEKWMKDFIVKQLRKIAKPYEPGTLIRAGVFTMQPHYRPQMTLVLLKVPCIRYGFRVTTLKYGWTFFRYIEWNDQDGWTFY